MRKMDTHFVCNEAKVNGRPIKDVVWLLFVSRC